MSALSLLYNRPTGRLAWCGLSAYYLFLFVFWIAVSQSFYHGPLQSLPVRLDATLAAWAGSPVSQHWFMFFLSPEDVAKGVPYANMPYLFTFFYAGYHVSINALTLGRWPFATTYFMTMVALAAGSWFAIRPMLAAASLGSAIASLIAVSGILVSSPYVTGFLLQANHDTIFAFNAIAATVLALSVWRDDGREGFGLWLAVLYCAISGLPGLITLSVCFLGRDRLTLSAFAWTALFGLSVANLVLPHIVATIVFQQTSASGLLFRTGLDGSTEYFTGHWQAFLSPYADLRSLERELSIKLVVAATLIAVAWLHFRLDLRREFVALGASLIPYTAHWIIFPQAVSIHPYLYDLLFLIPFDLMLSVIAVGLLVRFSNITKGLVPAVTVAAIVLLIHDNLLLLAQGKFIGV